MFDIEAIKARIAEKEAEITAADSLIETERAEVRKLRKMLSFLSGVSSQPRQKANYADLEERVLGHIIASGAVGRKAIGVALGIGDFPLSKVLRSLYASGKVTKAGETINRTYAVAASHAAPVVAEDPLAALEAPKPKKSSKK